MRTLADLSPAAADFLAEYHLGTLTTLRRDGSPHVAAVGFTLDRSSGLVRIITMAGSQKAVNAAREGRAVVAQVAGPRWLSLEGPVRLVTAASEIRRAEDLYAERYRRPRENPRRVVVEIAVDRVLGSAALFETGQRTRSPRGAALSSRAPSEVTTTMSSSRAPQLPER